MSRISLGHEDCSGVFAVSLALVGSRSLLIVSHASKLQLGPHSFTNRSGCGHAPPTDGGRGMFWVCHYKSINVQEHKASLQLNVLQESMLNTMLANIKG